MHSLSWGIFKSAATKNIRKAKNGIFLSYSIVGVGAGISCVVAISACVRYFSESYRATVVGSLSTGGNLGPILFTFAYQHWFYGDGSYEGQKLKEYFLFVAISCAACNFFMLLSNAATEVYVQQVNDTGNGVCSGVCEFFKNREMQSADQSTQPVFVAPSPSVREYSSMSYTNCVKNMGIDFHSKQIDDEDTVCHQQKRLRTLSSNSLTDPIQYVVESELENTDFDNRLPEPSQHQVLLSARFHFILWPSFMLLGLKSMNLGNLTSYLESFGQQQYILWLPYVSPAIAIVWKAVLGLASDWLLNIVPRIWFLIPAAAMFTMGYILALLWLDHLPCLLIVTVLWTCGADFMPGIAPAIMLEDFGMQTFSGNVGLMYAGCSVTAFFSQLCFGAFYDIYVEDGQTVCYGTICYRWSFMVSLALSVTCVTLLTLYARFYTETTNNKNENYKDHFVREIETEDVSSIQ